ncbi:haloacid dehalogenase [Virgisporangium aliadipatigenens]|uniref:Haloacid dehalogenase n=1 Tax=Virgisporangium aliadipatigenens TaxID=741659 RepID=A0A8J4DVE9_9ACTN|nr:HAD family hydrolase [Virgisporangium aliadipatigenens]GIJ50067.1 haloacid dehalogenase [Virgisporangium aliadipatigenens]
MNDPARVKLVATDLDGTLVRGDRSLSPRTVAVLDALPVPLVIATGRPVRWLFNVYEQLSHKPIAVVANGAAVYDPERDELMHSAPLSAEELAHACAVLREAVPEAAFAVERDGGRTLLHEAAHQIGPWERANEALLAELVNAPAAKLLVRAGRRDADEFTALVGAALQGAYEATHSSSSGLVEISAAGVTKASGLAWVAARLGVEAAEVVAFGDMPNDVPMLTWAGTGVAVANAHPAVLAAADEVTASNEDDGVALWIEKNLEF